MDFLEINIYTESTAVDVLVMQLSELGITGFVIHDSADFDEFLENKDANWDYVDDELMGLKTVPTHITLYLPDDAQGAETLAELRGALSEMRTRDPAFYGSLEMKIGSVREEDWANNWKQYYKPFNVGSKLIVKPSWEDVSPQDGRKILEYLVKTVRVPLVLDADAINRRYLAENFPHGVKLRHGSAPHHQNGHGTARICGAGR